MGCTVGWNLIAKLNGKAGFLVLWPHSTGMERAFGDSASFKVKLVKSIPKRFVNSRGLDILEGLKTSCKCVTNVGTLIGHLQRNRLVETETGWTGGTHASLSAVITPSARVPFHCACHAISWEGLTLSYFKNYLSSVAFLLANMR